VEREQPDMARKKSLEKEEENQKAERKKKEAKCFGQRTRQGRRVKERERLRYHRRAERQCGCMIWWMGVSGSAALGAPSQQGGHK
jgi:hypothetical protein